MLAMPFAYRSLDAGLRALDVKTLAEASGSLGGGLAGHPVAGDPAEPAHRGAVGDRAHRGAGARRVHHGQPGPYQTFPVWIVHLRPDDGQISVAASLFALFVTWIFLLAIT